MIPEDEIEKKLKIFNDWVNKSDMVSDEFSSATWAWENRMGQCDEAASTAYHILIMAYGGSNDKIISVNKGDYTSNHRFIIFGDIKNIPNTFYAKDVQSLDNTYIVDPWTGQSFSTKELGRFDLFNHGNCQIVAGKSHYILQYEKWLKWCKDNPVKYQDWLHGTSNYKPLTTSSVNNTGDASFKCPDNNPEPGNSKDQYFPKNHGGTYVKCRYHIPNKFGKSILASKIGYHENKKFIAEYFDSRNFLSKRIQYDGDGKKSEVTTFYDIGKPSSYKTYKPDGTKLIYEAWYKDGRKKF